MTGASANSRQFLRSLLDAAIESALPASAIAGAVRQLRPPKGRTVVIGAGKASAAMAQAFERGWNHPLTGCVVTRYGHAVDCDRVEVIEAGHPVPDEESVRASKRILQAVEGLREEDLVVCLLSGGGSSLLALPAEGISLDEKRSVGTELLRCGADIAEINCVRKHLSRIKGGRLALACRPARLITYIISDVPGDELATVASGPTLPDPTTSAEAARILQRYRIDAPAAVYRHLNSEGSETPKVLPPSSAVMLANAQMALEAAAARAIALDVVPHILSDSITGESREAGKVMGAIALQIAGRNEPFAAPCVLLSGGETTVTVHGAGRGGRNAEFAASLALTLKGHPRIFAISADTDGIDGVAENAGALVDPTTTLRAEQAGFNLLDVLERSDTHTLFEALGDAVVTGPTHTNVNDFRAILIV